MFISSTVEETALRFLGHDIDILIEGAARRFLGHGIDNLIEATPRFLGHGYSERRSSSLFWAWIF